MKTYDCVAKIDREDEVVEVLVNARVVREDPEYHEGRGTKPAAIDVVILNTSVPLNRREETLVLEQLRIQLIP